MIHIAEQKVEELESGQQLTKKEFTNLFKPKPKKEPKKIKTSERNEFTEIPELPNERELDEMEVTQEQAKGMKQAEEEIEKKQMVEYREKLQNPPESSVEMDNKLIEVAAKMAVKKELMPAKDNAGIERNVAIELEEEYPEPFTEDMVKGNFGDEERACVFGNMSIINAMKSIGQAKAFRFIDACRFNKAQMESIINISRAKGGFSAILVKTDKHVSEGVVQHVQKAFVEKKQKRWGIF